MDKLPKGWKIEKWDNVLTIKNGKNQTKVIDVNGKFPIYGSGGIMAYANDYLCDEFSTVIGRKGSINNPIFVETKFWNVDTAFGICAGDNLDNKYLHYFCLGYDFTRHNKSTTLPSLTKTDLLQIDIPLPPLSEQIRIVNKLDSEFERIDKSIALLVENIKHTEALMASVLEDAFKKLVSISKVYKIKEFADIKGGKRLPKGKSLLDTKTEYPYIRVTDFNDNGSVDIESIKYLDKDVQEQIKRYIITTKDVYISIAGTIGKTGIISEKLNNANLTENAARLVFKPNFQINNRFIYYFTLSDNFKDQIGLATKTVAQPKLALTRLAEVELPIPTLDIQNREVLIFDELSKKFQEIKIQQQSKLSYLKALKASLLDKAFKGEL
jgi:type I restriction enzyme S subunit